VDTEDLEIYATVSFATPASNTMTTVKVGFYRATIAWPDIFRGAPHLDHLHPKLVTQNSRVAKKRLPSLERVNIRAAHSNAAHSNQRFIRLEGSGRLIR
jgi:hypothetical protein